MTAAIDFAHARHLNDWRIELTDDTGLTLFVMTFLVQEAPTVLRGSHTKRD